LGRSRRAWTAELALCGAAIALFLLWAGPLPTAPRELRGPSEVRDTFAGTAGPELIASPPTWWMLSGSSVSLASVWTSVPPGCTVLPAWFLWTLGPGGAEGALAPTTGPEVNFTAEGVASGVSELVVRSAASVRCGNVSTVVEGSAILNVTVEAPLAVQNLTATPNPVDVGGEEVLRGWVSGGTPPYRLEVHWGDGNTSVENVSAQGPFSLATSLPAGAYHPLVSASDAVGGQAEVAVEEAINSSATFAAAIRPSTLVAEVGVPVEFSIATLHAPSDGFSTALACANASTPPGNRGPACTFVEPGLATVDFEGVGADFPYPEATAVLAEPVDPPFSLTLPKLEAPEEVGRLGYVPVDLGGGVPPFSLSWHLVGAAAEGTAVVPTDGTFFLAIAPGEAGADLLSVHGTDGVGVAAAAVEEVLDVEPSLNASVAVTASPGEGRLSIALSLSVTTGAPPYYWSIAPSSPTWNGTPGTGNLTGPGSAPFSGLCDAEGALRVSAEVVDAAGAAWNATVGVPTVPRLAVNVTVGLDGEGALRAQVRIAGGAPPFAFRLEGSDGESWNESFPWDGAYSWSAPTTANGAVALNWTVVDGFGVTATGSEQVVVDRTPSPSLSGAYVALGAVGALGGFAGLFAWRRRLERPVPKPAPDPVETLRAIVEPADGADRALVELEAEEAGLPFSLVRETLDRLIANGTILAERGVDGEEVLAWERRHR
jgi:hypothetical protein